MSFSFLFPLLSEGSEISTTGYSQSSGNIGKRLTLVGLAQRPANDGAIAMSLQFGSIESPQLITMMPSKEERTMGIITEVSLHDRGFPRNLTQASELELTASPSKFSLRRAVHIS